MSALKFLSTSVLSLLIIAFSQPGFASDADADAAYPLAVKATW